MMNAVPGKLAGHGIHRFLLHFCGRPAHMVVQLSGFATSSPAPFWAIYEEKERYDVILDETIAGHAKSSV
ncbi:hypothetical protein [Nonomuraea sp. NPDC003709]|uniref:hypothetical protein n=1 Tax=Nonomuraea sp. NPDC003709 TaxID=3154450 RepID=UPI0033A121D6